MLNLARSMLPLWCLLAGCSSVSQVRDVRTGQVTYTIDCSGPAPTSWSTCYQRAEKQCPDGYETLTTTYEANPPRVSLGSNRKITIQCKPDDE